MSNLLHPIGQELKVGIGALPDERAAATVTSDAIDRLGFDSALLYVMVGATSGTPDALSVKSKLQHADTAAGSYTDVTGAAITEITAASTVGRKSISLKACKRYLKVVSVIAFTNGTSPKVDSAVALILGGAVEAPAASDT